MPDADLIRGGFTRMRGLSNWRLRTQEAGGDPALIVANDGTVIGVDPAPAAAQAVDAAVDAAVANVLLAGLSGPAATALGGHRLVTLAADGVRYYEPAQAGGDKTVAPVALTLGAVNVGEQVSTLAAGTVDEPSWGFAAGLPVFAGPGGSLTQTPPAAGVVRVVAWAVTPTRIYFTNRQGFTRTGA